MSVLPRNRETPGGFAQISLSTSAATGLTAPAGTTNVWLNIEGGDVRFRADGTPATRTVGTLLKAGTNLTDLSLADWSVISMIVDTASSVATVNVHYDTLI